MTAASNKDLGELHRLVAESLAEQLRDAERIEDPADRAYAIKEARAQAITFLKNNNITSSPEHDDKLAGLKERLAQQRRASTTSLLEAAEKFGEEYGRMVQ